MCAPDCVCEWLLFVRVNHSKNAIVKPQGKTPEMAQREVDEAMKKVREATMAIANAVVEQRELLGLVMFVTERGCLDVVMTTGCGYN